MYFLDSDFVRKLAQYNLIDEFVNVFSAAVMGYTVLEELKFQLKLNDENAAALLLGDVARVQKLKAFLVDANSFPSIDSDVANEVLKFDLSNLDFGEQTLFAAVASDVNSSMISGDKRAYIAISKVEYFVSMKNFWERLFCLEEVIFILSSRNFFQQVSAKIFSERTVDKALTNCFGVGAPSPIDQVLDALSSYINALINETGNCFIRKC